MLDVDGLPVEAVAVDPENVVFDAFLGHRPGGKHDSLGPRLHRHAELYPLTGLVAPFDGPGAAGAVTALVADDLVREPDVEIERPRLRVDAVGDVVDLQALNPLLRPLLRFKDRGNRTVVGGGPGDVRDVLLEGLPFDKEARVIGEDGERVAGGHVLATFDGELLENEGDLRGRGRCPDDDLP